VSQKVSATLLRGLTNSSSSVVELLRYFSTQNEDCTWESELFSVLLNSKVNDEDCTLRERTLLCTSQLKKSMTEDCTCRVNHCSEHFVSTLISQQTNPSLKVHKANSEELDVIQISSHKLKSVDPKEDSKEFNTRGWRIANTKRENCAPPKWCALSNKPPKHWIRRSSAWSRHHAVQARQAQY